MANHSSLEEARDLLNRARDAVERLNWGTLQHKSKALAVLDEAIATLYIEPMSY